MLNTAITVWPVYENLSIKSTPAAGSSVHVILSRIPTGHGVGVAFILLHRMRVAWNDMYSHLRLYYTVHVHAHSCDPPQHILTQWKIVQITYCKILYTIVFPTCVTIHTNYIHIQVCTYVLIHIIIQAL